MAILNQQLLNQQISEPTVAESPSFSVMIQYLLVRQFADWATVGSESPYILNSPKQSSFTSVFLEWNANNILIIK